jgi:hypothetical protein
VCFENLKIFEGVLMAMDSEGVYQLRRRVFFKKQTVRTLLAESDSFTHRAGILADFDELDRVLRKFLLFLLQ